MYVYVHACMHVCKCVGILWYAMVCLICYGMLWCAMVWNAMERIGVLCLVCYGLLWFAMVCYTMVCYAMFCYVMLQCAMLVFCYVMLCFAMLCYAMLCYAMLFYAMLCRAVPCSAILCSAMLCYVCLYVCLYARMNVCTYVRIQSSSCLWRDLMSADSSPWSFSNSTSKLFSALCNCALRTLPGRFRDVLIFFSSATGDFDRGDLDRASIRPTGSVHHIEVACCFLLGVYVTF